MSKYANFSNSALLSIFASLDQRRKSLLKFGKSLEDQRDIDLMKIKTHWDSVSKAEQSSSEGERYLVHWQARKAYWAQKIEENINSIKPLMEEYHGVEALLKERGVNTNI